MDNRKFESGASATPPTPPASPSTGYPTNGNPSTAVPATLPGEHWFHQIGEELRGVILAAGLTPNNADLTQLTQAIQQMISSGGIKVPVRAATTANIASLAGGAPNTLDGVALVANDRLLVKDQATASQNGIYVVTTLGTGANGTWTRAGDADSSVDIMAGMLVVVSEGVSHADAIFELATDGVIVVGTTNLAFTRIGSSGGYMLVRDEKSQGTAGGSSVAGLQTRTLNTVSSNTISGASLASNQITLPAGTYRIRALAGAIVNQHRAYLYNVTDAAILALGRSINGTNGTSADPCETQSEINCRVTFAAIKVIELRHRTSEVFASNGLGAPQNADGVEVYSVVEIIRE